MNPHDRQPPQPPFYAPQNPNVYVKSEPGENSALGLPIHHPSFQKPLVQYEYPPEGPYPPPLPQNPHAYNYPHAFTGHHHQRSMDLNISRLPGPSHDDASRKRHRRADHLTKGDDGDLELKQLAFSAAAMPLAELAHRIKSIENDDSIPETRSSANSASLDVSKERQRQIFGMVWLLNLCELSPTAVVPRNRIYARYVQICADNSLSPLSPASFGKLVRILFPALTTRRLGMRGQSKYHYCGIKLVGDQNFQGGLPASTASFGLDSPQSLNPNTPSLSGSPSQTVLSTPLNLIHIADHFHAHPLKHVPGLFSMIEALLNTRDMSSPLVLPSIYPYLPKDTDYDIADTLYLLYRVHCTSIFESLRYMHIRKIFLAFSGFASILTAPVFKLYTSESVLEWVRELDLVMYRTMAKMLTKLHLQSVPDEVVSELRQVTKQYVAKLLLSLQTKMPKNFVAMKMKHGKNFVVVLSRLLKVIETGQLAARILNNYSEKQSMVEDWMKLDLSDTIMREAPCSRDNVGQVITIFSSDIIRLLEAASPQHAPNEGLSVLVPIAQYLAEMPAKFARVNPRLFLLVASNLLTTCLREISLNGGQGFGAWWIVRCWTDEYLAWCFELGGFLQDEFPLHFQDTRPPRSTNLHYEAHPDEAGGAISATHETGGHISGPSETQLLGDPGAVLLRAGSVVDLLDGAYGPDAFKEETAGHDVVLNYDIFDKHDDILG